MTQDYAPLGTCQHKLKKYFQGSDLYVLTLRIAGIDLYQEDVMPRLSHAEKIKKQNEAFKQSIVDLVAGGMRIAVVAKKKKLSRARIYKILSDHKAKQIQAGTDSSHICAA